MKLEITPSGVITLSAEHPLERALLKSFDKTGIRIASTRYGTDSDVFYRDYPTVLCIEPGKLPEVKNKK